MTASLALSGASLDRAAHHRTDEEWLASAWQRAAILRVGSDGTVPVEGEADHPRLALASADQIADAPTRFFLGEDGERPYFAAVIEAPPPEWAGLRQVGALLGGRDAGLLATSVALTNWHRAHTHCPRCGTPTQVTGGGWLRSCPADGSEHYPRMDPAVIMLVHDGGDRCLLGRGASWPEGRFSTLAGFVEPGESAEQAVIREVAEETGVAVDEVRYLASQPWPFPSSLMLGFTARVADVVEPRLLDGELAEARWFERAELLADSRPDLPPPISISQWLISTWVHATDET
ncbi:MAG: NAD(+) diphosphatase [Mycobacteriales bacterium]